MGWTFHSRSHYWPNLHLMIPLITNIFQNTTIGRTLKLLMLYNSLVPSASYAGTKSYSCLVRPQRLEIIMPSCILLSHFHAYEQQPVQAQYPLCSLLLSPLCAAASPACLIASSSPRILAKWALISSALMALPLSANSLKNGFSFSLR
jgi:hypothetical protein